MSKETIQQHLRSATAQFKRLAIANFWETRADALEKAGVVLFMRSMEGFWGPLRCQSEDQKRQAFKCLHDSVDAREYARQALHLPDDGAEKIFEILVAKPGAPGEVKTVVEPDDGEGKVN